MSAPDSEELERLAGATGIDESLLEKDWFVVRTLAAIADVEELREQIVFAGGTSLSKAFSLIQRFSEDIDFRVVSAPEQPRSERRAFRNRVIQVVQCAGLELIGEPEVRNSSRFVKMEFRYPSDFAMIAGMRPHLQVELTFESTLIEPRICDVTSFVARGRNAPAEVPAIHCVDPVETGADKLSALCWRVLSTTPEGDRDPSLLRHLHDIAALKAELLASDRFPDLVRNRIANDLIRGDAGRPREPDTALPAMLRRLQEEDRWAGEYKAFVANFFYGRDDDRIEFPSALTACEDIVAAVI